MYCFIGNSHVGSLNTHLIENAENLYCLGASILGLTNTNSKLQLKEKILDFQNNYPNSILIFVDKY